MKKRTVTKLLSCALAFSMAATAAPVTTAWASEVPAVSEAEAADEETVEDDNATADLGSTEEVNQEDTVKAPEAEEVVGRTILQDGKLDKWAQDPATVLGEDSVNEISDAGFLHFKAGSGNNNSASNAAQYPAMFVNPNTFDFTKAGYFEFDLWQMSSTANTRFGVYLDYKNPGEGMFLGYDKDGWFWQKYSGGDGAWFTGTRVAAPDPGKWIKVRIDWTADGKFSLTLGGTKVFQDEASGLTHGNQGKIAFKCSTFSGEITEVYLNNIYYTGQVAVEGKHVTGKVVDEEGKPISGATVSAGQQSAVTAADGTYDLEVLQGTHTITISKEGYVNGTLTVEVADTNISAENVVLIERTVKHKEILQTDDMSVEVAKYFPSIVKYEMKKGVLKGKTFYGQPDAISTIKINGVDITLNKDNVKSTFTDKKATYEMALKGENIDCVITAEIAVDGNTASFDITKVDNKLTEKDANGYLVNPVQTIEIPNHSMISVNSAQQNAHFKGAKISSNTRQSGDKDVDVTSGLNYSEDFMYGFISNNEMSAGLWSNSENEGSAVYASVSGGSKNTRVIASTSTSGDVTSLGLASAKWYYDRKVTTDVVLESDAAGNSTTERRTYVVEHEIMPSAKVVIAGDENKDGDIDWQDGAVAFRSIMHNPLKSEEVPELVNYRIAMNFGSHAANPFLTNLDGVKRVYLNTEGLGQGVLLKGYGSEGHDSGHPDYADIGKRIGGAEDMNKLLVEGKKMGALFGIHVNASEMYTEAKAFNDNLSRGYGGVGSGWNWLDQGIGINSRYDLATGSRESRFKELYEKVGNNLDFIYVDVWGNGVSNSGTDGEDFEDAWASRMLAREITSLGWRFTTEWGATQEYDSTLQHWAADLHYGGYNAKGENSVVMRFLRNHQKDSWVADYPSYGGAAQAPLLGGLNMVDFEGWQGRTDYKNYITVMFRHNLITKYLQHYQVVDWKDGNPVQMSTGTWTPEMEITLRNTKDASDNTELVVSRKTNDISNLTDYRSRTITLNGVKISEGAPTGGDIDYVNNGFIGNEKYLIPWNWDFNGDKLADGDKKMYHWNTQGGTSEWTLTKDWQGLKNVVLYKLTDEGKTDKRVINVVDNKITLDNIEAEIPYVIFKGEKAPLTVDWQSSKYVYDMGFNDPNINSNRTVSGAGTASIADNGSSNNMLKLEGQVSVSTQLTNLKKGQKYALYVGVDSRSDAKAHVTVKSGSKELATNYATRSFLYNYVSSDQHNRNSHTEVGDTGSCFQNMFLFFTADNTTATLSFDREAGDGATYFDDIRVVETTMDPIKEKNEEGLATVLTNDFEDNAQGIWPFVVSHVEGVSDNRTHLSERHDKYTQSGYMCKKVDDVLDGNWSVKSNGLSQRDNVVYQTIPQNFRFEPGATYAVSFDYQMGSNCAYEVRLGDGATEDVKAWELPAATGKTKRFGGTFVADSETGDNWIGIYSTTKETEDGGLAGNRLNFAGYNDFILDNLRIEKVEKGMFIDKTYTEVETAKDTIDLKVSFAEGVDPNTEIDWSSSNEEVALVNGEGKVYFVGFGSALISAQAKVGGRNILLTSMVYYPDGYLDSNPGRILWQNTQETSSENGAASNILDGNSNSIWHSNYSTGFTVSESNPAIVTVEYERDISEFENFVFQQRPTGGNNGIIQKYECIVGSDFDSATHEITGERFTTNAVNTEHTKSGEFETIALPDNAKGRFVQFRVLQGYNDFAAMAELMAYTQVSYDTEEERAFMTANKTQAEKELLPIAKNKLNKAIDDAKSIYDAGNNAYTYTDATWNAFKKAYDAAKAGASLTDRAQILKLTEDLKTAQANLKKSDPKYVAARKALKTAVDKAKPIYSKGQQNYTSASWKKFKDAYVKAEAELKKTSSTTTMNNLANALTKAQKGLEKKPKKGETFSVKNVRYKITSTSKKTVTALKGTSKKATSITIASKVTYKGVTFKVTEVSAKAFKGYSKLKKVTIGSNVKTIKTEAFAKCSKLESVKIGKSVSTIDKKAFLSCKKLKTVTFEKTSVKKIGSQAFKGTNSKMKVKLPKNTSAKKRKSIKNMMKKAGMSSKATVK